MYMKKAVLFLLPLTLAIAACAESEEESVEYKAPFEKVTVTPCKPVSETIQLTINYDFRENSYEAAKKRLDAQEKKINEFIEKNAIKLEVVSQDNQHFHEETYPQGSTSAVYIDRMAGHIVYKLDDAKMADTLASFLSQQNMKFTTRSQKTKNPCIKY
jgi:hypothetical protein